MKRFRNGRSAACRTLTLALCLALALTLAPAGRAAAAQPVKSCNINAQDYSRWSSTVNSYLYENPQGGLTRVEYTGGQIVVEDYDSAFQFQSGRTIPMELTTWGGFFAGQDYNFFVFGQNNPRQDDSVEVIRVVKYSRPASTGPTPPSPLTRAPCGAPSTAATSISAPATRCTRATTATTTRPTSPWPSGRTT